MFIVNINAMVVNGSNHKEQTKTELICIADAPLVSITNADFVYLSMEKVKSFIEFKNGVKFEIPSDSNNESAGRGNSPIPKQNWYDEVTPISEEQIDKLKTTSKQKIDRDKIHLTIKDKEGNKISSTVISKSEIIKSWEEPTPNKLE
jgi:hypothetical protein